MVIRVRGGAPGRCRTLAKTGACEGGPASWMTALCWTVPTACICRARPPPTCATETRHSTWLSPGCITERVPVPAHHLAAPSPAHRPRFLACCARGIPSELASLEAKAARVAVRWGPHHPQSRRARQLLHHAYARQGDSEFFACRAAAALDRCSAGAVAGDAGTGCNEPWLAKPRLCASLQNAAQSRGSGASGLAPCRMGGHVRSHEQVLDAPPAHDHPPSHPASLRRAHAGRA